MLLFLLELVPLLLSLFILFLSLLLLLLLFPPLIIQPNPLNKLLNLLNLLTFHLPLSLLLTPDVQIAQPCYVVDLVLLLLQVGKTLLEGVLVEHGGEKVVRGGKGGGTLSLLPQLLILLLTAHFTLMNHPIGDIEIQLLILPSSFSSIFLFLLLKVSLPSTLLFHYHPLPSQQAPLLQDLPPDLCRELTNLLLVTCYLL